jgi:gibberellin 2-oxidase
MLICRSSIEEFATISSNLAQTLADILAEKMGHDSTFFKENCLPNTCYLRLNRYPPCPIASPIHGLMPHTDSDFITILYQDQVGGLQLVKDKKWIAVKPNPNALIINIGDLFQVFIEINNYAATILKKFNIHILFFKILQRRRLCTDR